MSKWVRGYQSAGKGAVFASVLLLGACAQPVTQTRLESGNQLPAQSAVLNLTKQLGNELVRQNNQFNAKQPLLVVTPVWLTKLSDSNALGRQIQQGLIAAMHDHQFNLLDINVAEQVRVTENGDFLLSRDWRKLPSQLPVEHVLVSTMSRSRDELIINSRIVNVTNNRVVSVASASVKTADLPGYLQVSESVVAVDGLLYRNELPGQGTVQLVGEVQ
ncbi:hypothetical protein LZP69_12520 [Shewanella sp. AS1]|uniref:FlgO family outer membrane protein n=1 Tax=Shewanella sp. AS1 TaxID=2907626 RepID=UPI001EE9D252|nr:FlgO family outer membrane protein [Shewanella sp. AS1]MCE9679988.1 hypothetical protein [Shewanella sp. AS1]